MLLQNKVADAVEREEEMQYEPTVYLFGWDGNKRNLTEELGQPMGETINDMQLDSMRHAIIITRGEADFNIRSPLPAGHTEFIIILRIPGAVFVARYLPSDLFNAGFKSIREVLFSIAVCIKVKLDEIANKDTPHERSLPENTYVTLYYPEAPTGSYPLASFEALSNSLKQDFLNNRGMKFSASTYSRNETAVTVTVPLQQGRLATYTE